MEGKQVACQCPSECTPLQSTQHLFLGLGSSFWGDPGNVEQGEDGVGSLRLSPG